ncbi:MAG: rhomboid family intramembrane serine protease [Woeseiaceae bacterium]|nr:rhomboid family intramembrane serine protease [Woeseiaceae bacterium]
MFLPIKADFKLPHFPVLTVVVCITCALVFLKQRSDWADFEDALARYCQTPQSRLEEMVISRISKMQDATICGEVMFNLDHADDPDAEIEEIVASLRPLAGFTPEDSREYLTRMLRSELAEYRTIVPNDPDTKVAYYTATWNPIPMVTSSFAHGSWGHIIFNLIFFIAFATTLEALVGPIGFIIFILVNSVLIGLTDSVVSSLADTHHWSLGLSGVVMGVMGAHAFLLPRGKIRCYYWFIVIFGSIAIPAWLLAAWYIGGDIYRLFAYDDHGGINVLAHVAGGIAGYFYAYFFLKEARMMAEALQRDLDKVEFKPNF